jgi:LmbE family N-acetylglucosaminyl deacetylase
MNQPDSWPTPQTVLVVLAHPDDPEFFCGATLARWARAGHRIVYYLLTCGDKGGNDPALSPEELCRLRHREQRAAARVIGAREVYFAGFPDGYLQPTLDARRNVVRAIRRFRPDVLVTCDPTNYFPSPTYINHPDHRAAGQIALEAVFPAAGNQRFFPELLGEGLQPHTPAEVWISLPAQPTLQLDVTDTWDVKIQAILQHRSQIGDPEALVARMKARLAPESTPDSPRYTESFRVIRWR